MTSRERAPSARRELSVWLLICAAGAGLALLAVGGTWASVRHGPADPVELAGGELAAGVQPLALASLAALVAVLATQGLWRRLIGAVIALCGLGVILLSWSAATGSAATDLAARRNPLAATAEVVLVTHTAWPFVAGAGGLLLLLAGVVAVVRGGRWAGMSDRYDRAGSPPPAKRPAADDRSLWEALDRGDDPTDAPSSDQR